MASLPLCPSSLKYEVLFHLMTPTPKSPVNGLSVRGFLLTSSSSRHITVTHEVVFEVL